MDSTDAAGERTRRRGRESGGEVVDGGRRWGALSLGGRVPLSFFSSDSDSLGWAVSGPLSAGLAGPPREVNSYYG